MQGAARASALKLDRAGLAEIFSAQTSDGHVREAAGECSK
jgi:hypothetical protein